jgi:hypothetical protein
MDQQFITKATLDDFGINLTGEDVPALLAHLNDILQERVGAEITEALSEDKLKILLDLQETASEDELGLWLDENVPQMEEIVQSEIDDILSEITEEEDDEDTK